MPESIYRRGDSLLVRVSAGTDPATGRRRWLSETVQGTTKSAQERAVRIRKRLRTEAAELKANATNPESSIPTGEVLDAWFKSAKIDLSANAVNTTRVHKDHYLSGLRSVPLSKLTVSKIEDYYGVLRASGVPGHSGGALAPSTIRRAHGVLHRALNYAERHKWTDANVASLARAPSVKRTKRDLPSPEVSKALLDYYADSVPEYAIGIRLLSTTGARRAEVGAIRWSDIDFGTLEIVISKAVAIEMDEHGHETVVVNDETKTGYDRRIGIDRRTADLLQAHLEKCRLDAEAFGEPFNEGDYLFSDAPGSKLPWRPDRITGAFTRARKKLAEDGMVGVDNVSPGDLRRYVGSQLIAAGWDVVRVAERLGNSPRTLMNNYAHLVKADDHDMAEHMANLLS